MKYIVFAKDETVYHQLQNKLSLFEEQILVKPGNDFVEVNACQYEINPQNPEHYRQLLATFSEQLPERIIFLWSWESYSSLINNIDLKLTHSVYSIFLLTQALLKAKPQSVVELFYCYCRPEGQSQPNHDAMGALAKTVHLESKKVKLKVIAITDDSSVSELLSQEMEHPNNDIEIRYINNRRWTRRLQEISPATHNQINGQADKIQLKDQGVYLVIGGLGGLGAIFAQHLATQTKANLALCGRSALNEKLEGKIAKLNSLGTKVKYIQADISNLNSTRQLIAEVKSELGSINGIIHSAGVIRDALIKQKQIQDFQAVLAPKVLGSIFLDETTKDEPLDFLILFSSIAALMGNVGQVDYSYANSFMDYFVEWRESLRTANQRQGRTLAINWPLWQEGGMNIDAENQKLIERTLGMQLLPTSSGLEIFSEALSRSQQHILAVEGDRQKLEKLLNLQSPSPSRELTQESLPSSQNEHPTKNLEITEVAVEVDSSFVPPGTEEQVLKLLQKDLVDGVIEILKISPKDADLDTDLSEFGFDSITFTTFGNRLNEGFNLEVTPVVFFEYETVRELSEYLYQEYQETFNNFYRDRVSPPQKKKTLGSSVSQLQSPSPTTKTTLDLHKTVPANQPTPLSNGTPTKEIVAAQLKIPVDLAREPMAIIGISGIMPLSENLVEFWQNLKDEKNLVTEVPSDRWNWREVYGDPFQENHKTFVKWGGFMKEVDKFDAEFFGISRREAELMDPQQRIFLEMVWQAIEDAGYKVSALSKQKVGLFCGVASMDYHDLMLNKKIDPEVFTVTGAMFSVLVNRISYLLGFRGPSEPVETACSSSLVAVHRAIQAIRNGECNIALAGGVHIMLKPEVHIGLDKGGFLSHDGQCKTFDKNADGYVRGEGTGVVLIKPLSQAEADGDPIYAKIIGSAVNHGGHVNTLTTPNPNAQMEVIVDAWQQAKVDPATISYIEAHGTGTALGDPIEIKALKKAFNQLYKIWHKPKTPEKHCGLGSVKSNIGHLEFAAGISGVMKMLLALKHKTLPASINFNELNPYIQLEGTPFHIVDSTVPWKPFVLKSGQQIPRRTGVSSFGFGGVNAHLALEEYIPLNNYSDSRAENIPQLFLLSAKNEQCLKAYVQKMVVFLKQELQNKTTRIQLEALAFTLQVGREFMDERLALVVNSLLELTEKLEQYLNSPKLVVELYLGNVKTKQATLDFLDSPEEIEEFIASQINKGNITKLANLWVSGIDIDWTLLPRQHQLKRISLPTYPFARERYWLSDTEQQASSTTTISAEMNSQTTDYSEDIEENIEYEILTLLNEEKITEEQAFQMLESL